MEYKEKELVEKAKSAKSVEELLALAKENGYDLDEEEAKKLMSQCPPKEKFPMMCLIMSMKEVDLAQIHQMMKIT